MGVLLLKLVAILPPSERLVAQTAMLQAVLSGHETVVVPTVAELEPHLPSVEVLV
ncbi:MAG: hypothetical protein GX496_08430, partial [Firmicutes bacterium]|nr:hypothetical protein [Bacillota bacterium]